MKAHRNLAIATDVPPGSGPSLAHDRSSNAGHCLTELLNHEITIEHHKSSALLVWVSVAVTLFEAHYNSQ